MDKENKSSYPLLLSPRWWGCYNLSKAWGFPNGCVCVCVFVYVCVYVYVSVHVMVGLL